MKRSPHLDLGFSRAWERMGVLEGDLCACTLFLHGLDSSVVLWGSRQLADALCYSVMLRSPGLASRARAVTLMPTSSVRSERSLCSPEFNRAD